MALDFGMRKREFSVFVLIAVLFVAFEGSMMMSVLSVDGQGTYEFGVFSNRLTLYQTDQYLGYPSERPDWEFYELTLGSLWENRTINVTLDVQCGILMAVISYQRGVVYYTENGDVSMVVKTDALNGTLVKYGTATTFMITTPEKLTGTNPYVIIVGIIPMGWIGNVPATRVFANLTYV